MKVFALVDLVSTDRDKVYRTQYFPFIQALARRCGHDVRWLCVGLDGQVQAARQNPFLFHLPPEDRLLLCQRLRELGPTHVLLNERLEPDAWREVREAAGDAEVARYPIPLERWFGHQPETGPDEELRPEQLDLSPDYHRELLNELAEQIRPYTWLMLGPICLYRRPLARNPAFAGVDLSGCASADACSFCVPPREERIPSDVVAAAIRQVLAAEATTPKQCRCREYVVNGAALWPRLGRFIDALLAEELPPSAFFFHCRADELVRAAPDLEQRLGDLEVRGHSLNVFSMGVENFSEAENRRFNKGLNAADVKRAAELMWTWEQRYPDTFSFSAHGGFSFILYTPWTTTKDLRENIRALRMLRSLGHDPRFALRTRMQLITGRAITALAKKDGLVTAVMDDHTFDSGCITDWDEQESAWRFADPGVALVYRFSRRLSGDPAVPSDDPDLAAIRRWLRRDVPAHCQNVLDLLELATIYVDGQAKGHPDIHSVDGLLEGLSATISREPGGATPLSVDLGPKGIQLCVQGPCDLACLFCNLQQDLPEVDEEEHFEALVTEIDRLGEQGIRAASWGIHHREPTGFGRLPELLSHARQRGITANLIITNAMRTADRDYLQQLVDAGATALVVTLVEYDAESADLLCQGTDVARARRQTFEHCRELGLQVHPVLLLMRANYQRVNQMLDLYGELLDSPTLQLVQPTMEERSAWFLPPLSGVVEAVVAAARQRPTRKLALVDIPRCVRRRYDEQLPNLRFREESSGVYPEACDGCAERSGCCGFTQEYLDIYGDDEVHGEQALQSPVSLDELGRLCARYIHDRKDSDRKNNTGAPLVGRQLLEQVSQNLLCEELPRGLTVTGVELAHNHRVAVNLEYRGQSVRIFIAWRVKVEGMMMAAGPLALMHPKDEPLDTEAKIKAARYVLRRLARACTEPS